MGKIVLSTLIILFFGLNCIFLFRLLNLKSHFDTINKEYSTFQTHGDKFKKLLSKLSILSKELKKFQVQTNLSEFLAKKLQEFGITFTSFTPKTDKLQDSYKIEIYQYVFDKIEFTKLISFIISCERDFPGLKVKMIDISFKEKKLVERATIEFSRVIPFENPKKN
jgi:hypothetical protein